MASWSDLGSHQTFVIVIDFSGASIMDDALLDNFSNLRRLPSSGMRSGEMFLSDRVLSGRFSLCPSRS